MSATGKVVKLDGTLASVEKEITRLHSEIISAARMSLEKAIKVGELLNRIRSSRKGKWVEWIEKKAPFSHDTAIRYMRCYENRNDPKFRNVRNLSEAYERLCGRSKKGNDKSVECKVIQMPGVEIQAGDGDAEPHTFRVVVEPEKPTRRHKSAKQINKELAAIAEQERNAEKQADEQLAAIIRKLGSKVKAAWPEFPGHLATHGKALSEVAERLQLNTPKA